MPCDQKIFLKEQKSTVFYEKGCVKMKKIAVEEHIARPEFMALRYATPRGKARPFPLAPEEIQRLNPILCDEGEARLAEMDKYEFERAVLMTGALGFDYIDDPDEAVKQTQAFNEFLAGVIAKHPDRYLGIATLPLQNGEIAAAELRRCMEKPGFVGGFISGAPVPNGSFIDEEEYAPLWKAAEETGAFLYLHPCETPLNAMSLYRGLNCLNGSTWSWSSDTATYVLRMVFSGLFDRFPNAKLIVGHLGETLPFLFERLDTRWSITPVDSKNKLPPSAYFKRNIWIGTGGNTSVPALKCCIEAMGSDRIIFATDYPFEQMKPFHDFIENADISEEDRANICYKNAEKMFNL